MAASKAMMRPVILSRPENMADLLAIFCDGGWATTSSPGCGAGSGGCGGRAVEGKGMGRGEAGLGRRQWLRLHAPRRGLPGLPRIGLIRILLLLRIALVGIALVGIALVGILRIALLGAAAGHARGW